MPVRRRPFLHILWVCLAAFLGRPTSLPAFPGGPEYFIHVWQAEDGLPQNAVSAIVQTRDGYLWIGTYGGLARFDGVRFLVFDGGTSPELKSCRVTSLFEDPSGILWIGQETGDLTRYSDGQFQAIKVPTGGKLRRISAMGTDEAGDLWLLNEDGLLTRARDGLVQVPPTGSAPGQVAFARIANGEIFVARQGRASRLENGKLVVPEFVETNAYVQGICPSKDGGLWVATEGHVRKWLHHQWHQDLGDAPWGLAGLTCFRETQTGLVVGGTVDTGFFVISPEQGALAFNRTNGLLPQNWIRAFCEDREGNLWLGAGGGGLIVLRAAKVATLAPPDRWQGRSILSICAPGPRELWIGTEGAGVYHLNGDQWEEYGADSGIINQFTWSLATDAHGKVWAGTWGGGVFVKDGNTFVHPRGLEQLTAPVPAILHGGDGVTWLGTGTGLIRYQNGNVVHFGEDEGLELPDVRAVLETSDSTVWFGMCGGGLGRLRDGALKQFRAADGLASDFVQALYLDPDGSPLSPGVRASAGGQANSAGLPPLRGGEGRGEGEPVFSLWIGTSSGLSRLRGQSFASITKAQGLADNVICHIADDGRGFLWLSSHGGIMRIAKADLNACADGATNYVSCLVYGKGEGMPTLECAGGLQPSGCKTPDGRLWFPTTRGLVVVNPGEVKANLLPPPVLIENVIADGKPVKPERDKFLIPAGRQRLDFNFTGLSFTVPEKVRFKYRLEGLEPDWIDGGTKRSVNYSYLPPGDYVFHVTACNNDSVWNEQGASVPVTVLPHFWQTWWFKLLCGVAAASLIAGTVLLITRRRMREKLQRLERQRAIERERTRIAKDIHDDLGASLTRITLLSQSARSELDHASPASSDVDRIYDTARELTRAMDEIVWAVNPQHDTLDSLANYLGRFAQDFLAAARIRCRLDLSTQLPSWPVTADIRHNLFLAFKEALHNAVRHSSTTEVRILLQIQPDGFLLRVEDQGCGFLPDASGNGHNGLGSRQPGRLAGGNGLLSMRQRLTEIGGRCEIQSAPGAGSIITFIVPIAVRVAT